MTRDAPKLRILQVLAHDATGGTELMVAMLARELPARDIDVEVAFLHGPGPVSARIREQGAVVHSLDAGYGLGGAAVRLGRLLRRGRYDVVNVYGIKASLIVRVLARLVARDTAIVCGVQGLHVTETEDIESPKARLALLLERWSAPLVETYEANSTGAIELLRQGGIPSAKLRYVPNGIDLSLWQPRAEMARPDPPRVLCMARFVPRKRHQDIVEAVALLRERGVECRVTFAGEGETLDAVRAAGETRGVADCLTFLGDISHREIDREFDAASAFCLPSAWEGMPAALMEAMARAVPVVGTAVNGIEDLIEDGLTGLLVPPRQPAAIADALERLFSDPELARSLAAAGRRRIEDRHNLAMMVTAKQHLYDSVASRAPFGAEPRFPAHKPS